MKKVLLPLLLVFSISGFTQNIGIGTDQPNPNAKLEIADTARGILIPRMDALHRLSIPNTKGLLVYDTTSNSFWYNNGSQWKDLAAGAGWALEGNAGTVDGTHFIGTVDNIPLTFKVNNLQSGKIDHGKSNTFWGYQSGIANTSGSNNTGTGFRALFSDTSGNFNTATGAYALFSNTSGTYNTAEGVFSLYSNNTGTHNTASGFHSLYSDSSGSFNTAKGSQALFFNKTGSSNTAIGFQALFSDSSGNSNAAAGAQSLFYNKTGNNNTASGYQSLFSNRGSNNTAIGYNALFLNTTGENNIALGFNAGNSITTGSSNINIGHPGSIGQNNTIRIGSLQSSTFIAGVYGITTAISGVQVFIDANGQLGTIVSSGRFKENIQDMADKSANLYRLRPVTFTYKKEVIDNGEMHYGLIAEEVEKIDPNMVSYDKDGNVNTVKYQVLTPLLLNELQKEHRINIDQQNQLTEQQRIIRSLQDQIDELKKMIEKMVR